MTEDELHAHYPLYHSSEPSNKDGICPICIKVEKPNLDLHIHNSHGPLSLREALPPDFCAYAEVIIQSKVTGKFLMVNEPAGISGGKPRYWLPAGRVDVGEGIIEAGKREAFEEAGIDVEITGALNFMNDYDIECP